MVGWNKQALFRACSIDSADFSMHVASRDGKSTVPYDFQKRRD